MKRSPSAIGKQNRRKGNAWANEVCRWLMKATNRTFERELREGMAGRCNDVREMIPDGCALDPLPLVVECRKCKALNIRKLLADLSQMKEHHPDAYGLGVVHIEPKLPGDPAHQIVVMTMDDMAHLLHKRFEYDT